MGLYTVNATNHVLIITAIQIHTSMTVPKVEVVRSCDKSPVWQLHNGDVIIESNQIGTNYENSLDGHWMLSSNARIELAFMIFETRNTHDGVQMQ